MRSTRSASIHGAGCVQLLANQGRYLVRIYRPTYEGSRIVPFQRYEEAERLYRRIIRRMRKFAGRRV